MRIATLLPVSHIGILVAHFGSATSPYIGPLEYQILGYTGALPFPPSAVRPTSVLKGQLCRSEPDALLGPSATLASRLVLETNTKYHVPYLPVFYWAAFAWCGYRQLGEAITTARLAADFDQQRLRRVQKTKDSMRWHTAMWTVPMVPAS